MKVYNAWQFTSLETQVSDKYKQSWNKRLYAYCVTFNAIALGKHNGFISLGTSSRETEYVHPDERKEQRVAACEVENLRRDTR